MILTFDEVDEAGVSATKDAPEVATIWRHYSGNVYVVTGHAWCGDTDTWMILHRRQGQDVTFVRSIKNFLGNLDNGLPRFTQVI